MPLAEAVHEPELEPGGVAPEPALIPVGIPRPEVPKTPLSTSETMTD